MENNGKYIILFLLLLFLSPCFGLTPLLKNSTQEWKIIFRDEFDSTSLDWNTWSSDDSKYIKNETYRGKENIKVENGELHLNVTNESKNGSKWMAASIFMNQVLENNSFVECRFRSTQCTGVNNAFWLANKTSQATMYSNRYEIDMVEARLDDKTKRGNGHIAWHDWKTFNYTMDDKGKKFDIAQGVLIDHSFDEYHTWGLWYGENDIVVYLDGEPVWNGKKHDKYTDQWWTGIGKSKSWNPIEEKRTYGKFGQDDWSYRAGYNGDKLNVMLSTLPWGEENTPLTDDANGKFMAIDYVRIFRPKALLNNKPIEQFENITKSVLLKNNYSLAVDTSIYFSMIAEKKSDLPFEVNFVNENGGKVFSLGVDMKDLFITFDDRKSSTKTAYPAIEMKRLFETGNKYLFIGRITAHHGTNSYDRDAVSFSVFDLNSFPVQKEPYFYPNIDAFGNTSLTNEWQINAKGYSESQFKIIQIKGNWNLSSFKTGYNYFSVLPVEWQGPTAQLNGCELVKAKTNCTFDVEFSGDAPYTLTYSQNSEIKKIENITTRQTQLTITPKEETIIKLVDIKDAAGMSGYVTGNAHIIMKSNNRRFITPTFDTFTQVGKDADFSGYQYFEMKGDPRYEREMYLSFDLKSCNASNQALFFIYCAENEKQLPMILDVLSVDSFNLTSSLNYLNSPCQDKCTLLGKLNVPAKGGQYIGCNLGGIVRKYQDAGKITLNLKLKFSKGDESNMIRFVQGHSSTTDNAPKIFFVK